MHVVKDVAVLILSSDDLFINEQKNVIYKVS